MFAQYNRESRREEGSTGGERSKSDTNRTGVTGAYSSVDVVPFSKANGRDQWLFLGIKCQFKMID